MPSSKQPTTFKERRCIIPANGFYEWTGEKGAKQPHLFTAADGSPVLAFAGLWDRWLDPESDDEVLSCTPSSSPVPARGWSPFTTACRCCSMREVVKCRAWVPCRTSRGKRCRNS